MIYVYSGLPPGNTGTGQLVSFIINLNLPVQAKLILPSVLPLPLNFVVNRLGGNFRALITSFRFAILLSVMKLRKPEQILILHPQTIGFDRTISLIRKANNLGIRVKFYVLDNSIFCVKSYNIIQGGECVLCVDQGHDSAFSNNCRPFPKVTDEAYAFRDKFLSLVQSKKVNLYFQCESQKALIELWSKVDFSSDSVVGMWTSDLETCYSNRKKEQNKMEEYDIVFHGSSVEAKGYLWSILLAQNLPQLNFLFPFSKPENIDVVIPHNCHFVNMTWDTGLKEMVEAAKAVLVPSLWSAPVEGALIKSIICSKLVFAVDSKYGFAPTLKAPNLFVLPINTSDASRICEQLINTKVVTHKAAMEDWLNSYRKVNVNFMKHIIDHSI